MASVAATQMLQFGHKFVKSCFTFLLRNNVYGLVNLKPIVPGHVLVVAKRNSAQRLQDLTEVETLDFWLTVQEVSRVMQGIYKAECQICVQDGSDAGNLFFLQINKYILFELLYNISNHTKLLYLLFNKIRFFLFSLFPYTTGQSIKQVHCHIVPKQAN